MSFVKKPEIHKKVWGHEEWIVNNEDYCGKKFVLNKGYFSSYHFHNKKHETFYIAEGLVEFTLDKETKVLKPGDVVDIKPKTPHKFKGLKTSVIFEFSTTHSEDDVARITEGGFDDKI